MQLEVLVTLNIATVITVLGAVWKFSRDVSTEITALRVTMADKTDVAVLQTRVEALTREVYRRRPFGAREADAFGFEGETED